MNVKCVSHWGLGYLNLFRISDFKSRISRLIWMLGFVVAVFLPFPTSASAENIDFSAEVDMAQVTLDSRVQLILTLKGAQNIYEYQLPAMDGFDVQSAGSSTHVTIINNRSSFSRSFNYFLYPKKTGKFTIPSFSIDIDGKTYSTQPIEIEVMDEKSSASAPSQGAGAISPPSGQSASELAEKIFVVMGTPSPQAYLNEKVPLTIKFFVTGVAVSDIEYPVFAHDGFLVDELDKPRQYQQTIGGVRYEVLEWKTHIYPTRSGEWTLGPAKIVCQLIYRNRERSPVRDDFFGRFFDDEDFFNGFFDLYEKRPITLESTDLALTVLPPPEEGRPEDFSGAVGQFDFEVSVNPKEVNAGDPLTVRMNVIGNNLKSVTMPALTSREGLKVYDPQIKEEANAKTLEQVAIPTTEQLKEIPAVRFSYFDPQAKAYQTITRGPFPVTVKKTPRQDVKVVGFTDEKESRPAEEFGRDIVFIKEEPGEFRTRGARLYQNVFFWLTVGVFFTVWIILFGVYRQTHKLRTDEVYARRLQAPRKARQGLAQARALIQKGKEKDFYDVLFKTLQEYLGDKFHLPSSGLTFAVMEDILKAKKVDGEKQTEIKNIFEECDMVRYAAANLDSVRLHSSLIRLEKVIDYLERNV